MGVWRDIKEPVDYINAKYKRPMYLFACSLGGICATIYLMEDAKNTPIKAATFYGSPIAISKNEKFFNNSMYGLYNYVFGDSLLKKQREKLD